MVRTRSIIPREAARAAGARFATIAVASAAVVRACALTSPATLAARPMTVCSAVPLRSARAIVLGI